jgi:hypothetical protein
VMSACGPIYRAREGLEPSEVDDGYVIYDEVNAKVLFLNPTAAAVLELCDGVSDLRSIASMLQSEFDLPHAPEADVAACLESLLSQGLVIDCSPSSSAA